MRLVSKQRWMLLAANGNQLFCVIYGDLKRGITGISQKMLTQQLRELEEDNIIERKVYNQVPPKVEYYLSDYGQSLSAVLDNLCNWGESHVAHLQEQGQEIYLKTSTLIDNHVPEGTLSYLKPGEKSF